MTWKMAAKKANVPFEAFSSAEEFKSRLSDIHKDSTVYIDSNLGSVKGEEFARELFELGFKEIYLSTGYEKTDFPVMPWIKDVVGKVPPW